MTEAQLSEVDLDRIADYAAGVLTPAQSAQVADLIATDCDWATTYRAVLATEDLIRKQLRDFAAAQPVTVPSDVAARWSQSLDSVARERPGGLSGSLAVPRRPAHAGRARRWLRPHVLAAAATLVVVVGSLAGLSSWLHPAGAPSTGAAETTRAERQDSGLGHSAQGQSIGTMVVIASGTDYRRETLRQLATRRGADPGTGPSLVNASDPGVAELVRLHEPAALNACLRTLVEEHPGTVTIIDYARFQSQPALIVVVESGGIDSTEDSAKTTVAVGPRCGLTGSAELASD